MAEGRHRVYVFAQPRSTSHLFYQLLSGHPAFQATRPLTCLSSYRFGVDSQSPLKASKAVIDAFGLDYETVSKASWQNFLDDLQKSALDAESKGKRFLTMDHPYHLMSSSFVNSQIDVPGRTTWSTPVVVDHKLDVATSPSTTTEDRELYSNPTLIPDRFFFSFTPIITTRHPAHAIPSGYRAFQGSDIGVDLSHPDFPVFTSFKWTRLVLDSFKSYGAANAIVVDGEKLVKDPQGQMKKVCDALGLDEGGIRYNWDKPELWKGSKFEGTFFKTLNESSGVVPDPKYDKPLDIETEEEKWAEEWDEDTAKVLRKMVEEAMEDYQYLLQCSV
ncbi:hypothetical protein AAF712_012745 [Marasmius tenuissimus]|uniref:P-loop containing nucleoside triphosphate hydrolase protein n=1 Tax=Marasmius tenuissimus TaxID=585030 RepID=A0ABR2ZJ35_9AGAR|nr:hypothetical protein PM082_021308 [Marasmius tenuissimus]